MLSSMPSNPDASKPAVVGATQNAAGEDTEASDAGPVDFATFLVSLSSSAFFYLGEVPHPSTGRVEKNLALARQTIDLLALLQQKTRGNLTDEERQVLEGLLYELRMRYVEETKQPQAGDSVVIP